MLAIWTPRGSSGQVWIRFAWDTLASLPFLLFVWIGVVLGSLTAEKGNQAAIHCGSILSAHEIDVLCKWLEENEQLSENFFCSRNGPEQDRDANNIIPTIAYQMAQYSSSIRSALCRALEKDSDAGTKDINTQFKMLVQQPIQVKAAIPEGVIVVIAALDDPSTVRLLKTLLKRAAALPMKFFVASRPEHSIEQGMRVSGYSSSELRLHDIDKAIVQPTSRNTSLRPLAPQSPPPTSNCSRNVLGSCSSMLRPLYDTFIRQISMWTPMLAYKQC